MLSERRLCFDPDSADIEQNQTHLQLQSLFHTETFVFDLGTHTTSGSLQNQNQGLRALVWSWTEEGCSGFIVSV